MSDFESDRVRVIIFADAHANWDALLALQRAEAPPDAVLFLGDAVGFGPEPAQCVEWIATNATQAIRGDCDDALAAHGDLSGQGALACEASATLELARRTLSARQVSLMAGWPKTTIHSLGGARFFLAHDISAATTKPLVDVLTAPEADLRWVAEAAGVDFVLLGHTHVPALRKVGGTLFVNPGSLGQPRYGVPDPTYAVWTDGAVQIRHLPYQAEPVCRKLALLPLEPEIVAVLTEVLRTGSST